MKFAYHGDIRVGFLQRAQFLFGFVKESRACVYQAQQEMRRGIVAPYSRYLGGFDLIQYSELSLLCRWTRRKKLLPFADCLDLPRIELPSRERG